MGNRELLSSQCRGISLNLELIWATPSYLTFLRFQQCSSRLVTDFRETLCSSVKQIKAPSLVDWEQGIALNAVQGNRASSPGEGDVSWDYLNYGKNLGYILDLPWGWPFEAPLCSVKSGFLSSYD